MANLIRYPVARLLTLGLVFHLIFIYSVFDCYFTSPVVSGMKSFGLPHAESKRLVLIVGECNDAFFSFKFRSHPSF